MDFGALCVMMVSVSLMLTQCAPGDNIVWSPDTSNGSSRVPPSYTPYLRRRSIWGPGDEDNTPNVAHIGWKPLSGESTFVLVGFTSLEYIVVICLIRTINHAKLIKLTPTRWIWRAPKCFQETEQPKSFRTMPQTPEVFAPDASDSEIPSRSQFKFDWNFFCACAITLEVATFVALQTQGSYRSVK